jgi:hypothetical protein
MSYFENRPAVVDPMMDVEMTARVRTVEDVPTVTLRLKGRVASQQAGDTVMEIDVMSPHWLAFVKQVGWLLKELE